MQLAIVLMGDQHLGNVPLGDRAQLDELVAHALWWLGDGGHVATGPYPFRSCPRQLIEGIAALLPACAAPTALAGCAVTVDRGGERGGGAAAAAAGARCRGGGRASCDPGSTGGWPRSAASGRPCSRAATRSRTWARRLTVRAEPGRTRVTRRGETLLVPRRASASGGDRALVPAHGARGDPAAARPRLRAGGAELHAPDDPRSAHALGQLLARAARSASTGGCCWRREAVLDYVVWHEVCHLAVMDHSPRFWALVARYCPDHREHAAWLRRNAGTLVL